MLSISKEKDNYNCIMEIMNVGVCEGLRKIFKIEWDKHYGVSKGIWEDTHISGNELYNMERTRPHAKRYLQLYKSGKRSEWDLSALSDAILYSNAIKMHLSPHIYNKVDELRNLRNSLTHSFGSQHKMTDSAFEKAYKKVRSCFKVLKISNEDIEKIRASSKANSLTRLWAVRYIFLAVFIAGVISRALLFWVTNSLQSKALFSVLPTRPVHLIANRSRTVEAILGELRILSTRNNHALTYLYISGNPGSGKSQLARLVGQRYETIVPYGMLGMDTFVMTINGKSVEDIYKSYANWVRRMNCNEENIARIINSNRTTAEITENLKTEIAKTLKKFANKCTWLLVVDNVVKLREISPFLPQLEDRDWQDGQVLITTQDASSLPPNSSLTVHISVSQGMDSQESGAFLTNLSGLVENHDIVSKVGKELDYQPLALASAAFYVKQLRESKVSPDFSWKDYLQKLNEGKRNLTETKLSEVNHAYSLTMSTAVLLAVKMFAEGDLVLKHAFTFLSYVSHEALSLGSVVSFVLRVEMGKDREDIALGIQRCSLVLSSEDQKVVSISMHRVVHDSIKTYTDTDAHADKTTKFWTPLYVLQSILRHRKELGTSSLIPHLREFCKRTDNLSLGSLIPSSIKSKQKMQNQIFRLISCLINRGEFQLSKHLLTFAIKLVNDQHSVNNGFKTSPHQTILSFPKIGEIYAKLGEVEGNLGNLEEASKYFILADDVFSKQHKSSHENIRTCRSNLWTISCLSPQGCSERLEFTEEELKSLSDRHKGLYYSTIGRTFHEKGNLIQAEIHYLRAMDAFMKAWEKGSSCLAELGVNVANLWSNLGAIYLERGYDYERSKAYFKSSIDLYLTSSREHFGLGGSYYNMAIAHFNLNELAQAEKCFRRALEIFSRQLDPSHARITMVLTDLTDLLEKTGRFNEAANLRKMYSTSRRD